MRYKFYFIILLFSIISNFAYAKPRCDIFFDKLKSEYAKLSLSEDAIITENSFGFNAASKYNNNLAEIINPGDSTYLKGDIIEINKIKKINQELRRENKNLISFDNQVFVVDKSKEGYFKVGKIRNQKLAFLLETNDLILSANGEDIRNLDLYNFQSDEGFKKLEDLFDKDEEIEIVFQSYDKIGKKFKQKIKLKNKEVKYDSPILDFYLESVALDEKNGTVDVTLRTDFEISLPENFPITKLAREVLFYQNNDGTNWFEECIYSIKEWDTIDTVDPNYGIVFNNLISKDNSKFNGEYLIYPLLVGAQDGVTEDELLITYRSTGEYRFKNEFKLHSFPFDRQEMKIHIYQSSYELGSFEASRSSYIDRELGAFTKKNNIPGWNIVDYKASYKTFKPPNYDWYTDGVELSITFERKSVYYIFKVIFPILLILLICWSAIWIDPKEIESRLTITIVCLLSLIAYNFVIDSDMPKLEYLTIMDYIILISYVYAAIPNFLSIYSFQLSKKNKVLTSKYESYQKRYGLLSYISIVFLIIIFNANSAPEHTNSFFTWASMR